MPDPSASETSLRRSLIQAVVGIGVVVALLVAAEVVCRAVYEPSRLDRILALLERDPDLLWRLRADLDTTFENAAVRTNDRHVRGPGFAADPPAGRVRVVCMGASPTFGWGVPEDQAYPAALGRLLAERGIAAETINGGVPGYTTWQAKRWLARDVLAWSPDIVTVAYDLNDLDIFRFFSNNGLPDSEQQPSKPLVTGIQNRLNRSVAYRLLRRSLISGLASGSGYRPESMPVRVPLDQYRANLLEIDRLCRQAGVQLVYVKMPVNLPFHRLTIIDAAKGAEERELGEAARAVQDTTGAIRHLEESRRLDPTEPEVYRSLASAYRTLNRHDEAETTLALLPFVLAFRVRSDLQYNAAVDEVGARTGRPVARVVEAFEADGRGMGLWNSEEDPFHPNAEGHALIARVLAAEVAPLASKLDVKQ